MAEHKRLGSPLDGSGFDGPGALVEVKKMMALPTPKTVVQTLSTKMGVEYSCFFKNGIWVLVRKYGGNEDETELPELSPDGHGFWSMEDSESGIMIFNSDEHKEFAEGFFEPLGNTTRVPLMDEEEDDEDEEEEDMQEEEEEVPPQVVKGIKPGSELHIHFVSHGTSLLTLIKP